jgi:hypothetical protein
MSIEINNVSNIVQNKMWLFILIIIGAVYLVFSLELTTPLLIMLGITILFFGFDYFTWGIFFINAKNKDFAHWAKAATKVNTIKEAQMKKEKSKIVNHLIISVILIIILSFGLNYFNPLYIQVAICCILTYMLYLYYGSSSIELMERIPKVMEEAGQ